MANARNATEAPERCSPACPDTSYRLSKKAFCTTITIAINTGTGHQRRT